MVKIEKIKFGDVEIDGKNYGGKDLYVSWDGKIEERIKSHVFSKREFLDLVKRMDFDVIIVATGFYGAVKIEREVFGLARKEGKELLALKTEEACKLFNNLVKEGRKVLLVLHSTC